MPIEPIDNGQVSEFEGEYSFSVSLALNISDGIN